MPRSTRSALSPLVAEGYSIRVGDYSYGVPAVRWSPAERATRTLTIGKYCSFAADIDIYVGRQGRHTVDFLSTYPIGLVHGPLPPGDKSSAHSGDLNVSIGSDVWVGRGAQIMAGVAIGDGAVIGARSLVTKNVAPYTIVAGTPAIPIRMRFNDDQIEELLRLRWWELPDEDIRANIDIFNRADIDAVLSRLRQIRTSA